MKATSASALTPRKSKPRKRAVLGSDIAYLLEFWAVSSGDPVFGQAREAMRKYGFDRDRPYEDLVIEYMEKYCVRRL
jgi:hypothetical protein